MPQKRCAEVTQEADTKPQDTSAGVSCFTEAVMVLRQLLAQSRIQQGLASPEGWGVMITGQVGSNVD